MTIKVALPEYLKEWFVFRMGGSMPVVLPKGSPYSQFMRMFLRPKRERESRENVGPCCVEIEVPSFPGKRPEIHNYLPANARCNLVDLIRDSFDLQLWSEFVPLKASPRRAKDILMTWMEENGIEVTDRNYESVNKRLKIVRRRETYRRSKQRHHDADQTED